MTRAQIILALDVASVVGWAVFHGKVRHASGSVKLRQRTINKVKEPRASKYLHIVELLDAALEGDGPITLLRRPDLVVMERTGGGFKSRSANEVIHGLQGHVESWAYTHGIPVRFVLNWTSKRHATGNRNADKDAMLRAARRLWKGVKLTDDNEADALHAGRAYLDGYADAA